MPVVPLRPMDEASCFSSESSMPSRLFAGVVVSVTDFLPS